MHKIKIKNMVCNRCIMVVEDEFNKLDIKPLQVTLGEVVLEKELDEEKAEKLESNLTLLGFEWIKDKKLQLIDSIKTKIIELVHYSNEELKKNLSTFISEELSLDYNYLSNIFSEIEGITIENYYITQKVERVKELLDYGELNLSEIADQLNYSSVAYLSNQFKKVTGITPTTYRNTSSIQRRPLDEV